MSGITVHQCLHGYRRGHELLAGSTRLPPPVADTVTRLSDLSGSLITGCEFTSYLTGYPLLGVGLFALARTWEDKLAARAGCVLTHTLLIPLDAWRNSPTPRQFSDLFASPEDLRSEERFKKPLRIDHKAGSGHGVVPLPQGTAIDFVHKFYGEGHRPLVWFDCPDAEAVAWSIVGVHWPSLRQRFSWCTASLQPRSLDTRFLDLQFAPSEAYSRFHKIPRENVVSRDHVGTISNAEPWCEPCAEWIFSGEREGPVDVELRAFGPYLNEDPTLLRHLFLAHDLANRLRFSPTAGAGLLDVVETLAPGSDEAVDYKSAAAQSAVRAATAAEPEEALKCLFLVSERLTNTAFQEVLRELESDLVSSVAMLSAEHPREALLMPERIVSRPYAARSPYFQGLVTGLSQCARNAPSSLICLRDFKKAATHLVGSSASIARGFLRGIRQTDAGEPERDALVGWIRAHEAPELRKELRKELLPEVRDEADIPLIEVLLKDVPPDEVGTTLTVLMKGTHGFAPPKVLRAVQEAVAGRHADAVRQWALEATRWSPGATSLTASTFPQNEKGLRQVVEFHPNDETRRAELLTSYLDSCTETRVPGWFKDAARESADWLASVITLGHRVPAQAEKLLGRLLPELREVPVALRHDVRRVFPSLTRFSFWPSLIDLSLRGAISAFVEGRLSEPDCRAWFAEEWSAEWLRDVARGEMASALIHPVSDMERLERAFRWLAFAPASLYQREPLIVPDLFWELISERRFGWTRVTGDAWAECIRRVRRGTQWSESLRMCADILQFGFSHTSLPVGAAVAAAFYPVYRSVCDSNWTPVEVASLFGWFDWDKAKELRKELIRAFFRSGWSPGDLAMAAVEDEGLLRKLVKRILRFDDGEGYVTSMLNDLESRSGPEAAHLAATLRELASDPGFYEPWD